MARGGSGFGLLSESGFTGLEDFQDVDSRCWIAFMLIVHIAVGQLGHWIPAPRLRRDGLHGNDGGWVAGLTGVEGRNDGGAGW